MFRQMAKNEDFRLAAAKTAQIALYGYRTTLKTKLYAAEKASAALEKAIGKDKNLSAPKNEKERETMKRFISTLAVVAAAGAALGAAGYYLKKKKETQEADYEELLYSDEMGEDFTIEEPEETFVVAEETADEEVAE